MYLTPIRSTVQLASCTPSQASTRYKNEELWVRMNSPFPLLSPTQNHQAIRTSGLNLKNKSAREFSADLILNGIRNKIKKLSLLFFFLFLEKNL